MTAQTARTRSTPAPREPVITETRTDAAPARGTAIGRDGQPIRRVRSGTDKYFVDPAIIPDGWVYQWNCVSILGQPDPSAEADLARAGWTPVEASRHDGLYLPKGYKGAIIIGGLRLDERPIELQEEARAEEKYLARAQVQGSREQFGLAPKSSGFEGANRSNNPRVHQNTFARSQYEVVDAPQPKHEIAID